MDGFEGLRVYFTVLGVLCIIGLVIIAAGFGVMVGQMWARLVAILAAGVSAIVNIAFLAAYPIWSLVIITLDVIVIYAVAVHGRELRTG